MNVWDYRHVFGNTCLSSIFKGCNSSLNPNCIFDGNVSCEFSFRIGAFSFMSVVFKYEIRDGLSVRTYVRPFSLRERAHNGHLLFLRAVCVVCSLWFVVYSLTVTHVIGDRFGSFCLASRLSRLTMRVQRTIRSHTKTRGHFYISDQDAWRNYQFFCVTSRTTLYARCRVIHRVSVSKWPNLTSRRTVTTSLCKAHGTCLNYRSHIFTSFRIINGLCRVIRFSAPTSSNQIRGNTICHNVNPSFSVIFRCSVARLKSLLMIVTF